MHLDAAADCQSGRGSVLLIAPWIVSFAVAVYLIIAGILGLNGIYHIFQ
jgi:hypothetical protein